MPKIIPLKGLRYSAKTGPMDRLVTPPYDIIDETAQKKYYQNHPCNIIRLEYGKVFPDDDENNNRYTRAAADFIAWRKEGVLEREEIPAIYRYEQKFFYKGELKTRRGFICGVKLQPYEEGEILPHEETIPGHKADRLALMQACESNFSPIFGLFADKEDIVGKLLLSGANDQPPDVSFVDENGQEHNLWVITETEIIKHLQQVMRDKRIFIADGHHRYETALEYKRQRRIKETRQDHEHLYDYIMMTLVNLYDPGLVILPTHRIIRNIPDLSLESLLEAVRKDFTVESFALNENYKKMPEFLRLLWERKESACISHTHPPSSKENHTHAFGLYGGGNTVYLLTLKDGALSRSFGEKGCGAFNRFKLDVQVLQNLILDLIPNMREGREEDYVSYTRDEEKALKAVDAGEYQLAFFLNPTSIEEVVEVAAKGGKMPRKSTYFYPKLITGLVINLLK
jgi:uncharacterized protein (DUF1015 family)